MAYISQSACRARGGSRVPAGILAATTFLRCVKGRHMTRTLSVGALLLALAAPATAQSGRVFGVVADPSGAILPAVEIRATMRDATGETTRSVVTDGKGRFEVASLSPGAWVLSMSVPGFETATRRLTLQGSEA